VAGDARASACALDHVVISTGDLDAARALYGEELGLRLALDRPFPKRGIQILFFRLAGVTVEVVGALADAERPEGGQSSFPAETDRFGGLAWRVDDVRAARARLEKEGFDVSQDRAGHKAGTRVFTVRSSTHGVPTLVIGQDLG
jgi:catechol 2,3-dioxygenase-like lactoylglutathione lyase family enzyme